MTRAVARALRKAWDADIDLAEIEGERVHDLALIEQRMKARLPSAVATLVRLGGRIRFRCACDGEGEAWPRAAPPRA